MDLVPVLLEHTSVVAMKLNVVITYLTTVSVIHIINAMLMITNLTLQAVIVLLVLFTEVVIAIDTELMFPQLAHRFLTPKNTVGAVDVIQEIHINSFLQQV